MAEVQAFEGDVVVVEETIRFTLAELCRSCRVETAEVVVLVEEGVLDPVGSSPADWQFSGSALRRARLALRLAHDLEIGVAGSALVLELLDEIETLRARLRRAGLR